MSFATLRKPRGVDVLVKAAGRDLASVRRELLAHVPAFDPAQAKEKPSQSKRMHHHLCSDHIAEAHV